jgi:inositol hexakisphosphate/diphosphoinositol-pentakisphosphate kinase
MAPISAPPSVERNLHSVGTLPHAQTGDLLPPLIDSSPLAVTHTFSASPSSQTPVLDQDEPPPVPMPSSKHSWKLKGMVSVIRHADRTPKQKIKFTAHSQVFVDLLKGHHEEVLLKGGAALASVEAAVRTASQERLEDPDKLRNLRNALARKGGQPDTKVQIKPMFRKRKPEEMRPGSAKTPTEATVPEHETLQHTPSHINEVAAVSPAAEPITPGIEADRVQTRSDSITDATFSRFSAAENDLVLDKLQLVMKWGGEPTHSARYQAQDLGSNMRDDYKLMNREILEDVRIFTSSEKRVRTHSSSATIYLRTLYPSGKTCSMIRTLLKM